jgi:hypothetical protein
VQPDQDVLQHGHLVEQPLVLECACDAELGDCVRRTPNQIGLVAVEDDPASGGTVQTADYVEKGGLPRSVRADEACDLARLHGEIEPVHGAQAAEGHGQA